MPSTLTDRLQGTLTSSAIKAPCPYRTTSNITLRGLEVRVGGAWVATLPERARVFVSEQTDPVQNGIYEAKVGNWERARDFNGQYDVVLGTRVLVEPQFDGGVEYVVTTPNPVRIGVSPITFQVSSVGAAQQIWRTDQFTGTGSQVVFALSSNPGNKSAVDLTINGLTPKVSDYVIAGTTLTFLVAPALGDQIEVRYGGSPQSSWRTDEFVGTGSVTTFTLSDVPGSPHSVDLSVNGLKPKYLTDYTIIGNALTFVVAPALGDQIEARYGASNTTQVGAANIVYDVTAPGLTRTLGQYLSRTVSPSDGPWFATTSPSEQNTAAIQACLNWAAGRASVLVDGMYEVTSTLRVPSNSNIYGQGDSTGFRMASTVGGDVPLMQTGADADRRSNIRIAHLWLDYNTARWANSSPTLTGGLLVQRTLGVVNSEWVRVENCRLSGGKSHNIDITNPGAVPPVGAETYGANPSRYVFVENCRLDTWGDDAITTHHSSQIWITNCVMRDPSGTAGTTGGVELDDGSRNVFVSGCEVVGAESGYALKGHGAPAAGPGPYNVQLFQNRAVNCNQGLMIRQSGSGGATATLLDYQDETTTGFSRTAMHVIVDGLEIIAPRSVNAGYTQPVGAMDLQAYTTVFLNNIIVSDGTEDLTNKDWLAAGTIDADALIKLYSGIRRVHIGKLAINGFRAASYGIRATGTAGGTDGRLQLHIEDLVVRDGPKFPLYVAVGDAKDIYVGHYDISGKHLSDGGIGMYASVDQSADNAHIYIGPGRIQGYETKVEVDGKVFADNVMHLPTEVRSWGRMSVIGTNDEPVTPFRFAAGSVSGIPAYVNKPNSDNERWGLLNENLAGSGIGGVTSNGTHTRFYPNASTFISGGAGTPEGAITGNVGSVWFRSDGTSGSRIYMKTSGTGSSGWTAIA